MTELVVVKTTDEESLQRFSQYLWGQGIAHRIAVENNQQLLLVGDEVLAPQVRYAYEEMRRGNKELPIIQRPNKAGPVLTFLKLLSKLPVTLMAIIISILGFCVVYFDRDYGLVKYFTFFDFETVQAYIIFNVPEGQYWRLITPIFLHFSLMHIAFNMAILWFVGQRIELLQGSTRMLGIMMVIGLGSNIMQAVYSEAAVFGGMSGVVYGLLGYGWMWSQLRPHKDLMIPNVILYFSLVMMLAGFAGVTGLFGAGKVANVAHLGGLIMGSIMGAGAAMIDKLSKQ